MDKRNKKSKIAFIVGKFPAISETFIINQVADLNDRGVEIEIFSFTEGVFENISQRFYDYEMVSKTHYLNMPENVFSRCLLAIPKIFKFLVHNPAALARVFNFKKYGRDALSLKLLYWTEPFFDKQFDLYHCHFGQIANKFLIIKEILGIKEKMTTSFYGLDVSSYTKEKGAGVYDRLKKECFAFIVMSNNMKERVVAQGFDESKITVLPISIEVDPYPFWERSLGPDETIQMVSIGRFVEKKGFDDLLRALAIVKQRTTKLFKCHIIGGGPLEAGLKKMTNELNLGDAVEYKGYMKIEDIIKYFQDMHFYLQPSKTAANGDME
ncbi:glycosyltransferase [Candidatus Falkowbacteria bacterium]|nr:glycosyltransferase [Candidatus Falkowbacteria bacterium]